MRKSVNAVPTVIILVIILLVSLMCWFLWEKTVDQLPPQTVQVDSKNESLETDPIESQGKRPEKIVLPPKHPGMQEVEIPLEDKPLGPNEGLLQIRVIHNETGEPVQSADIELEPDTIDEEEYDLFDKALDEQGWGYFYENIEERNNLTDSSGLATIRLPAGLSFSLKIEKSDFTPFIRFVKALQPGEHREIVAVVGYLVFYGQVVENSPTQPPLKGVTVRVGEHSLKRRVTDASGIFSVRTGSSDPSYLSIQMKDYGPAMVKLTKGHETLESAMLIKLDRAAGVFGKVTGSAGPASGALVKLSVKGYLISQGHDSVFPENPQEWMTKTDKTGFYRLEGLPPNVELRTEITLAGRESALMHQRLLFESGEERRIDWDLGNLKAVRGWVIDQHGYLVAGIPVIAMAPDRTSPYWDDKPDDHPILLGRIFDLYRETRTDHDGAFELSNLPPGRMLIGVFPYIHRPNNGSKDKVSEELRCAHADVCPVGLILNLKDDSATREITIKVHRGLYIRGRVLDAAGITPVNSVSVYAFYENFNLIGPHSITDQEGRFEIGPFLPGRYKLKVLSVSTPDSEIVEAEAGDENVLIQLGIGGELGGRISLEADLNLDEVLVWVTSRERGWMGGQSVALDGTFSFKGYKPGLYDLYAYLDDLWVGVYLGARVTSGKAAEEVHITLEPAAELVLRFKGYEALYFYNIEYKGYSIIHNVAATEGLRRATVPPGMLRVVLYERIGEEEFEKREIASKDVFVQAGEDKEVVFEKDG